MRKSEECRCGIGHIRQTAARSNLQAIVTGHELFQQARLGGCLLAGVGEGAAVATLPHQVCARAAPGWVPPHLLIHL